jgi:NAD(P)H-dependent FMN reductase
VRIGIVVYSLTGHTVRVARRLEERLAHDGHTVSFTELEIVGPVDLSAKTAPLRAVPPIEPHDALVLASPVNGGRMCAAMAGYLDAIPSLEGKRVACLVTHFFVKAWGAKQTLDQMRAACESRGATVCGSGSVRWSSFFRGLQISRLVESLADCLSPKPS